ncbi:conserved oligomeric Golgi complex subunit 1, partial [Plakobranchus ocellatus]
MKSIAQMEMLCTAMRQKHMLHGASFHVQVKNQMNRNTREVEFYGTAAQIKLLMDFPEKIWSSVDCQEYLNATQLYLLARHINTNLHLDSHRSFDVSMWFPVLSRQWTAISHFKSTILQGCRSLLCDIDGDWSDQQMSDVLCSIIFLEDSTPRQVFTEFLLARTRALQEILHPGQNNNVKSQIIGVARLLTCTLRQINSVFYCQDDTQETTGHLLATLNRVVSSPSQDHLKLELHGSISSRCLPKSVKSFKPLLKTPITPLSAKQLKDNCQQWMNTCLQEVQSGVARLLNYVNSVKRLADIRDSLWDLLTQVETWSCWEHITTNIVCLQIWDDFFKPLFVDRAQKLIQHQLETTAELMKRTISKAMMELTSDMNDSATQCERNLANFVWTESPADIILSDIWQSASTKTLMEGDGLMLKARTFTPAVQNLCQSVDEKLKLLLEDAEAYVEGGDSEHRKGEGAFDRFADTPDILKCLQISSTKCVQEILNYLTQQLHLWEKSLIDIPDPVTSAITKNKVLLTARTCAAMSEMTPHLQRSIVALPDWNKHGSFKLTKRTRYQTPSEVHEWHSIYLKLQQCQMTAYRIWMEYTYKQTIGNFSEEILNSDQDILLNSIT